MSNITEALPFSCFHQSRGIQVEEAPKNGSGDDDDDDDAVSQMSRSLDSTESKVRLDESGALRWPVLFMYPEYGQTDYISSFHENHRQAWCLFLQSQIARNPYYSLFSFEELERARPQLRFHTFSTLPWIELDQVPRHSLENTQELCAFYCSPRSEYTSAKSKRAGYQPPEFRGMVTTDSDRGHWLGNQIAAAIKQSRWVMTSH